MPVERPATRSPTAPGASTPSSPSRPEAGGAAAASPSRARRVRRHRLRAAGAAGRAAGRLRASIHSDAQSVDAEPSQPMPTGTPAARSSRDRRQPGADQHVRARAVGHARAPARRGGRSRRRSGRCSARPTTRSVPQPHVLEVLDRAAAVGCAGSSCPRRGPRPGACGAGRRAARPARRCACISSGVTENGEHGASGDAHHRARRAVVVASDQPLGVGEDLVVVLHDRVGRQPAVLLRQAHRAAGGVEAHAELAGRRDLGGDQVAAAARVHVEVVGRRRAPAERQLGQADPRRQVRRLLVEPAPQRVQRA